MLLITHLLKARFVAGYGLNSRGEPVVSGTGTMFDYRLGGDSWEVFGVYNTNRAGTKHHPLEIPSSLLEDPSTRVFIENFEIRVRDPATWAQATGVNLRTDVTLLLRELENIHASSTDLVSSFENRGLVRFDMIVDGTLHTAFFRCKGLGSRNDNTEPYIWEFTEAENEAFWNLRNAITDTSRGADRFLVDEGSTISFIPDISQGAPAGRITNKITSINEDDTHQYIAADVAGGIASFVDETPGAFISIDGVLLPKEVSSTTAVDSDSIGLYVGGSRVDGDSFRINAVSEKGTISNKIDELYAHQEYTYRSSGVQGGAASYRVKSGPGRFSNNTYLQDEIGDVIRATTVVVEQVVGGKVTDDDTFTLFPTIARIANKIDILQPDQTHQFRPSTRRAPGAITWTTEGGYNPLGDTVDANGVYVPGGDFDDGVARVVMKLDGIVVDTNSFLIPGTRGNLTVRISNPVEAIKAGDSYTFQADIEGRNLTGTRTVIWQALQNQVLFGSVTQLGNELRAQYDAPTEVGNSQGFNAGIEVIVTQSDTDGNSHTASAKSFFWVTPSFGIEPANS